MLSHSTFPFQFDLIAFFNFILTFFVLNSLTLLIWTMKLVLWNYIFILVSFVLVVTYCWLPLDIHDQSRKPSGLSFPRRVFAPWLAGTLICDYLQPSETLEVLKDHCAELMSMEVLIDSSNILEPEGEAPAVVAKGFWDVAAPLHSDSKSLSEKPGADSKSEGSSQKSNKQSSFNAVAAILVLLLSVLLGFLFLSARSWNFFSKSIFKYMFTGSFAGFLVSLTLRLSLLYM